MGLRPRVRIRCLPTRIALSWLGNWYAAGPLYQNAEERFHANGDTDTKYMRVSAGYGAQAVNVPLDQTLSLFNNELEGDEINPKSRLWCLALKGYLEINSDSNSAKRDWTEALQIGQRLGRKPMGGAGNWRTGRYRFPRRTYRVGGKPDRKSNSLCLPHRRHCFAGPAIGDAGKWLQRRATVFRSAHDV